MKTEDIKNLVTIITNNGGEYTIPYLKGSDFSPESCYSLYYGGAKKLVICKDGLVNGRDIYECQDIDHTVRNIKSILDNNILPYIHKALDTLGEEHEHLKYFDSEPGSFEEFKEQVYKEKKNDE